MLLFRSEEHLHRWLATANLPPGGLLTLTQIWDLARAWYGEDRRAPTWRRKTADEAHEIFTAIGLTSDFWKF